MTKQEWDETIEHNKNLSIETLNGHSEKRIMLAQLIATQQVGSQIAALHEMLEKKIVNILPTRESDGRLFKD